jgi:hypothetical protein
MVAITFTMNDDIQAQLLLDRFCLRHNYQETIPNPDFDSQIPEDAETNPSTIPNTETKAQFLKRITKNWWKNEAMQGAIRADYQMREAEMGAVDIQ